MSRPAPSATLPEPEIRNGRLIIPDAHGRIWRDLGPAEETA